MAILPPTPDNLLRASALIQSGELVAFPTETVYGLGANAGSDAAVTKIFLAKGRPSNNPLIVHIPSSAAIETVADFSRDFRARGRFDKIKHLWPGPISFVLPKGSSVARSVCGSTSTTVAVRIPNHPVALSLLDACRCPVAAPSANVSGYISPTTAAHVQTSMGKDIAMILDGGPCEFGLESTVISLVEEFPILLRPGAIGRELIAQLLGEEVVIAKVPACQTDPLPSPGLLLKHYSPRTKTVFASQMNHLSKGAKVGALWFSEDPLPCACTQVIKLSVSRDPNEIAPLLYSSLRNLDEKNLDLIVLDECSREDGLGEAIMDRLTRATQGDV